MNINEITNEMNAGETITTAEYNYWMENYDAEMHPWFDPLADYSIDDSAEAGVPGDTCAHDNSWASNCADCDEAEWNDQLMDPSYEPSIEREGIAW